MTIDLNPRHATRGDAAAAPSPRTLPLRTVALRRDVDFERAAERLVTVAEGEGYRIANVVPLSRRAADAADVPPAVTIELDAPELLAAVLQARPAAAALFPVRLLLVQGETRMHLSTIEPAAYRSLFDDPSPELGKRLAWLEVTLDIVLRYLA